MARGIRSRVRLLQVFLAVGAVLVVVVGAGTAAADHGDAAVIPLGIGAVLTASLSGWAAGDGLRSTAESLAGCAAGLALAGALAVAGAGGGTPGGGRALPLAVVAAYCLTMRLLVPSTLTWPVAAWAAGQLAVLRLVPDVPAQLHAALFLAVALIGLGIALAARLLVARIALVTAAPWWAAGVVSGTGTAWTAHGAERQVAAVLVVGAAAGLLPARLRAGLDKLLGPPVVVPLASGLVAGVAVSGALAALGTLGVTAAGYAGVLIASTAPEYLGGRYRLFRPVAIAGGSTMAAATLVQLSAGAHWGALSLLFLLTSAPTALVAWRRPAQRPASVPTAVGCLAGAVLFSVPAGVVGPGTAAAQLTGLFAAGLATALVLAEEVRRPTVVAAGSAAGAAVALIALQRDLTGLAVLLAVQGLVTVAWARQTARPDPGRPPSPAWRIGAAQVTVAAEIAAYDGGIRMLEAYTLPLAAALLVGAGPRLIRGPSWPAWGPGLLTAAVPSALLAVLAPGSTRPVLVLVAAAATMVAAGRLRVRAPLVVGAGTAVGVALGLAVAALLWPLAAVLAIGAVLLAVGARRERAPVAGFGARIADLR